VAVDVERLATLLADVEWTPDEQRLVQQAIEELRTARRPALATVASLFDLEQRPVVDDVALRFVIATPPSSKNEQKMRVIPGGKRGLGIPIRYRPAEVVEHVRQIQDAAVRALQRQAPRCYAESRPLLEDDDARVEMVHNVHNETLDVLVRRIGDPPKKGRTGRRRDVHNLPELVCDAIQRIAFRNDNQICDLRVWRNIGTPTAENVT